MKYLTQDLRDLILTSSSDPFTTTIIGLGFGGWLAIQLLLAHSKEMIASRLIIISFVLPSSSTSMESLKREWIERTALAQKWGMEIIADKAVVRRMSPDDRNSQAWKDVKQIVMYTTVEDLEALSSCLIQSLQEYLDALKEIPSVTKLSNCKVYLVTGSSDGIMPEEMPSSLSMIDDKSTTFQVIAGSPRLFWWGPNGDTLTHDLIKWISVE
jgi:pimeloyl-ACP methyl ester carboxylesterase